MSLCLNMIVKNEADNLPGCLLSVLPIIDHWVIVDTGSTDNSCEIILNILNNIPGTLYKRPWINFGVNRSEALELADNNCDYILSLDADFLCICNKQLELTDDSYEIVIKNSLGSKFNQNRIFKSSLNWKYIGALHEYPVCDNFLNIKKSVLNEDVCYFYNRHTGIRTKNPKKYLDDALLLEKENQNDPRTVYYLAQSYKDHYIVTGDTSVLDKSIINYTKRSGMGGFVEEVWSSLYNVGVLHNILHHSEELIVNSFLNAYNYWPFRVEPLYQLAFYYRLNKKYQLAFLFAEKGLTIPFPKHEKLLIDVDIYQWKMLDEYVVNAINSLKYKEALEKYDILLNSSIPDDQKNRIETNYQYLKRIYKNDK